MKLDHERFSGQAESFFIHLWTNHIFFCSTAASAGSLHGHSVSHALGAAAATAAATSGHHTSPAAGLNPFAAAAAAAAAASGKLLYFVFVCSCVRLFLSISWSFRLSILVSVLAKKSFTYMSSNFPSCGETKRIIGKTEIFFEQCLF